MRTIILALLMACTMQVGAVQAADTDFGQALRDKAICETNAQNQMDTGITSNMIKASIDIVDCQESILINLIVQTTTLSRNDAEIKINEMRKAYTSINYNIYNNRAECAPSCGTMFRLFPFAGYFRILDDLFDDIADANDWN